MTTTLRAGYVDSDWGQVHYLSAGDQGPWIGLLHESPLSSKVYEHVLEILGKHARVIAFDTPGYGASAPPPTSEAEIPEFATVLARAAQSLGMQHPVFAGVHTGASIAIEIARNMPVAGLSLSGVPLFSSEERLEYIKSWTPPVSIDADGSQFDWARERYKRIWPELTPEMLHTACVEVLRVAHRYQWGYQAAFRYDPSEALSQLEVPVLMLDAEFDMLAKFDEPAKKLCQQGRISILPGLQGQPHLRNPQAFSDELLAFTREVNN